MGRYVHAEDGEGTSVIYTDEFGDKYLFSDGTRTWRNHNPGNVRPGKTSKKHGSIGFTTGIHGKFSVFSDLETGRSAMVDALKRRYLEKNIYWLVRKYAPEEDGNDVVKYTAFLKKYTNIPDEKLLKDFTVDEFEKLCAGIERFEGYEEGTIAKIERKKLITAVQLDSHGIITSYCIESIGWTPKQEGIRLVERGLVDAVICKSRTGTLYLRCKPSQPPLKSMGAECQ